MRVFKWVLAAVGIVLGVLVLIVLAVGSTAGGPGRSSVPAGMARNEARYLTMPDGVRIAVDVWYPATLAGGQKAPTLIRSTRYVRTMEYGVLTRAMAAVGMAPWMGRDVALLNEAGYVVLLVDARGSGASFGTRDAEWSPEEVADMGAAVDWIVAQPWSNGKVGGYGVSYDGNTAELLAGTGRAAVKAVAPHYDDYDPIFTQAMAGGAFGKPFLDAWGAGNNATDANDLCAAAEISGFKCFVQRLFVKGTKPVNGDSGRALLAQAVAEHRSNYDVASTVGTMVYPRDSVFPDGRPLRFVTPYTAQVRIAAEQNAVPMLIRLGWLDAATMNTGIGRFFTQTNPMRIELGPWSHGGGANVDPFLPPDAPTAPARADQFQQMIDFFDGYLKESPRPIEREIRYYTMNDGRWRSTQTWPPAGVAMERWYPSSGNTLARGDASSSGSDAYQVDFTASSGPTSRWHSQFGGDVIYPDRAAEATKLLTYTSAPLAADVEITGPPVASVELSSTASDGLLFVYLEAVGPDGRVTYLTEGLLRALHRKVSSEPPPYHEFGPVHSFRTADGAPLVPGESTVISFAMYSTSIVVKAGSRLRVSIAGHDEGAFARVPAEGNPTLTIHRGPGRATWVDLPIRTAP